MKPVCVRVVEGSTTRELRRAVLRAHLKVADAMPGDDLAEAVHFAVLDPTTEDGVERPLAACFLFRDPYPPTAGSDPAAPPGNVTAWHLRSVAVDPFHQGTGLGRSMMTTVVEYVAEHGGGVLWCNARRTAVEFYVRIGFVTQGAMHVSDGLDHIHMWRPVDGQASA